MQGTSGRRKSTSYTAEREIRMSVEAGVSLYRHVLSTSTRHCVGALATDVSKAESRGEDRLGNQQDNAW